MQRDLTIWHLEMTDPGQHRPARPQPGLHVEQARIPCPELNRFFYTAVGGDLFWVDRLGWDYRRWMAYLDRPDVETWIGAVEGTPAGYFELEKQEEGNVELKYFGLLPQFIGRGFGGALLTAAIDRAWGMGASRIWVHTNNLDGPAALPGYQARGFRIFKEERKSREFPDESPGPWPGAGRVKRGSP
jgi:GNAT superfamily N-acetyltransferase